LNIDDRLRLAKTLLQLLVFLPQALELLISGILATGLSAAFLAQAVVALASGLAQGAERGGPQGGPPPAAFRYILSNSLLLEKLHGRADVRPGVA